MTTVSSHGEPDSHLGIVAERPAELPDIEVIVNNSVVGTESETYDGLVERLRVTLPSRGDNHTAENHVQPDRPDLPSDTDAFRTLWMPRRCFRDIGGWSDLAPMSASAAARTGRGRGPQPRFRGYALPRGRQATCEGHWANGHRRGYHLKTRVGDAAATT